MITVEEAKHIILQNTQDFGVEEIPFLESVGRVLKEDIVADRDFPPFNRVAMDGIAFNYRFFQYGVRDFKIEGIQPAGSAQETMENAAHCYEVMTGAVLPNNCDTVIRYEDVSINTLMATVTIDDIKEGQNIHQQGTDRKQNDILIKQNTIISPSEIGVLATVGKSRVKVAKLPKVMIVSTGDELVNVDEIPKAHQIRRSNVFTLVSLLNELKIPSETAHLSDEKEVLQQKIASFLNDYDVLLFSGAVSKGKFDFLPEVLEELGVKKLFHRVSQRPGKPFWMGITDALGMSGRNGKEAQKLVFAFPGNPVSTFVNCLVYFYPWYYKSVGVEQQDQSAILTEDVSFKPDLTYFLQVKLTTENGQLFATPIQGNGSGDLASLVEADGFIELPKTEEREFKKGEVFSILSYRSFK
ncbi:molybdopterin molybdotransferase MoeA [Tenacibaculum sp. IB213877]|uniref:molybdopterin molybdotransferase MoeA n=1 Tax=Tenacibaculum sp. IB213877 TaxID=3097351 RepID=UPI002A5A85E9|nr:molybdopterin molybdotransferase MoeA [Tenacibaculum sp. IB213877]MDY0780373.1 molybdopterin molybdotransferase MoeA [Tenacibaculum sp. IB213877]